MMLEREVNHIEHPPRTLPAAGRDLDIIVGMEVMGWTLVHDDWSVADSSWVVSDHQGNSFRAPGNWSPSTNDADALHVLRQLQHHGLNVMIVSQGYGRMHGLQGQIVAAYEFQYPERGTGDFLQSGYGFSLGLSFAYAMCLAALQAMTVWRMRLAWPADRVAWDSLQNLVRVMSVVPAKLPDRVLVPAPPINP